MPIALGLVAGVFVLFYISRKKWFKDGRKRNRDFKKIRNNKQ
jgi:hypothetical protein